MDHPRQSSPPPRGFPLRARSVQRAVGRPLYRSLAAVLIASSSLAVLIAGPVLGAAGESDLLAGGIGARERALGSGLVIAEPGVALFWNPARLALAEGTTVHAHLAPLPEGASLDAVGVAWPFGPGVLGGGLARIGVGDIETYDVTGVPTGAVSFGDVELSGGYALGFAWPFGIAQPKVDEGGSMPARAGSAFDVGVAFRIRRQSFADRAATGFGIDLGLSARPRPAFEIGLRARNLMSPSLTVGSEAEHLPRSLHLGAAYTRALAGRPLLLTAETGFGGGVAALAGGAEFPITSALSGRAGLAGGTPRFGVGFAAGFLAFDYGLESHDLGLVHLASVTVRFGEGARDRVERAESAMVAEREAAASRAAEEARSQAAAELRSQARATADSGDPVAVRAAWLALLAQHPGDEEAMSALAEIEARAAAAVRDSLERREQEHAAEIERLRAEARQHEASGDAAGAAVAWGRVLMIAPSDPAATANLARVQAELTATADSLAHTRANLGERDAELMRIRLFVRALEAHAADDDERALATLDSLLVIAPHDEAALDLRRRIAPSSTLNDPRLREEARQLYIEGMRLFNAGDFAGAIRYWEELLALDPGNAAVRLNLEEARLRQRSGP